MEVLSSSSDLFLVFSQLYCGQGPWRRGGNGEDGGGEGMREQRRKKDVRRCVCLYVLNDSGANIVLLLFLMR